MKELAARPLCHRCRRPVESFTEEETLAGRLRLVARCHGEREVVDLEAAEASGIILGEAFRGPALLGV